MSSADVRRNYPRVTAELVRDAAELPASILADVYGRRGTVSGRVAALAPAMKVAGPALTVEVRPGHNLMIHAALSIAKRGDVIVVDGKGDQTCALIGEIMVSQAMAIGVAGMIPDAAVRDTEALRAKGFPVWSFGFNPCGPTKRVSGRVNHPISLGSITVNPADCLEHQPVAINRALRQDHGPHNQRLRKPSRHLEARQRHGYDRHRRGHRPRYCGESGSRREYCCCCGAHLRVDPGVRKIHPAARSADACRPVGQSDT